jgi:hypothetical protein
MHGHLRIRGKMNMLWIFFTSCFFSDVIPMQHYCIKLSARNRNIVTSQGIIKKYKKHKKTVEQMH